MNVLIDDYQVTSEEQTAVKELFKASWDPNQHIVTLFGNIKTYLTILAEMKNVIPYPAEDFIIALYHHSQHHHPLKYHYKVSRTFE